MAGTDVSIEHVPETVERVPEATAAAVTEAVTHAEEVARDEGRELGELRAHDAVLAAAVAEHTHEELEARWQAMASEMESLRSRMGAHEESHSASALETETADLVDAAEAAPETVEIASQSEPERRARRSVFARRR